MVLLLSLAVAMLGGLLMTRVVKRFNLPDVTAYLIAGVLIGPYCLGAIGVGGLGFNDHAQVSSLELIANLALGFIAFAIGNEFRVSQIKSIGRQAFVIGIVQAVVAAVLVDIALIALHFIMPDKISLSAAITLGAIATATAPAATLMVVRQYKAKGELTKILLPVVALDDAVGLIIFAVSFGIARALQTSVIDIYSVIVNPIVEIVCSLALGAILGALLTWIEKFFHSNTNRLSLIISFVIMTVALSMIKFHVGPVTVGFSSLLVCMMCGTIFCNTCPLSEDLMERAEKWTAPLYTLFFVISGAELELSVFVDIAIIGIGAAFIIFRSLGKYFGAYFSAHITNCSPSVKKYLGITLLPQAGVALGMSVTASALGGADAVLVRNIVLFAVLIYELFGPSLTKMALTAAGDIQPMSHAVQNRRAKKIRDAKMTEK